MAEGERTQDARTAALVSRLRGAAEYAREFGIPQSADIHDCAANEIERLVAAADRVSAPSDEIAKLCETLHQHAMLGGPKAREAGYGISDADLLLASERALQRADRVTAPQPWTHAQVLIVLALASDREIADELRARGHRAASASPDLIAQLDEQNDGLMLAIRMGGEMQRQLAEALRALAVEIAIEGRWSSVTRDRVYAALANYDASLDASLAVTTERTAT